MTGTIGFTAARELSPEAADSVMLNVLVTGVPFAARYVTGTCVGGDAFLGRWLYLNRRDAEHLVIVPANRSRVDEWWAGARRPVTVIEMPPGTTYADRNQRIVAESDAVFGFPVYLEDDPRSRRSGTWQTIRMARKSGNLSQWHCLTPPYRGRIEHHPEELLRAGRDRMHGNH